MRLKATFSIEIDARDFIEAADHQARLEGLLERLRAEYAQASLTLCERRIRTTRGGPAASALPKTMTGRLHTYVEG